MAELIAERASLERVANLAELVADTPEIVLDLDVVRANIDRAAATARDLGVAVRPHTKTHKLPQIAHIVVVMMENHSYDNYFGMLDRGEGFPTDDAGNLDG